MPVVLDRETAFEDLKDAVKADDKGRIILGRNFANKNFRVAISANGEILLIPVVVIPERDLWLYKNPQALAMFHQGLAEAASGQVTAGEDFSQYAHDVIEDE